MPLPTKEDLLRHVKKYGSEGVLETAVECRFSEGTLTDLIEAIDKIEAEIDSRRRFSRWKKPRLSANARARKLLGIEPEGGDPPA